MPRGRPSYRPEGYGHPASAEEVRRFVGAIVGDVG